MLAEWVLTQGSVFYVLVTVFGICRGLSRKQ